MKISSKNILTLIFNDLKLIFRDKILLIILTVPLFMIATIAWILPELMVVYSDLESFYPQIIATICIVTAISPAYIVSFIMLDEKDEGLFAVYRISPLPPVIFLVYRLTFIFIFSIVATYATMLFSSVSFDPFQQISLAFLTALSAPITVLIIINFADNKIEGLTFLKGINFMIIIPFLSFFMEGPAQYIFVIIPTYWTLHAFLELALQHSYGFTTFSFILHLVLLWQLIRKFKRNFYSMN